MRRIASAHISRSFFSVAENSFRRLEKRDEHLRRELRGHARRFHDFVNFRVEALNDGARSPRRGHDHEGRIHVEARETRLFTTRLAPIGPAGG